MTRQVNVLTPKLIVERGFDVTALSFQVLGDRLEHDLNSGFVLEALLASSKHDDVIGRSVSNVFRLFVALLLLGLDEHLDESHSTMSSASRLSKLKPMVNVKVLFSLTFLFFSLKEILFSNVTAFKVVI